jgi:hypothetical protein
MVTLRLAIVVLVATLLASTLGCARAHLRLAMGRVQQAQTMLDDRIHARMREEIPAAVDNLERALRDPHIAASPLHVGDGRFAELLSNAFAGIDEFRKGSIGASMDDMFIVRGAITQACAGCHDEYKPR